MKQRNDQLQQEGLRPVPGALSARADGKVVYNMLDPIMAQFMGRCIGAVKKAGLRAKGSGAFSIILEDGPCELILDKFYAEFINDPAGEITTKVVARAQELIAQVRKG